LTHQLAIGLVDGMDDSLSIALNSHKIIKEKIKSLAFLLDGELNFPGYDMYSKRPGIRALLEYIKNSRITDTPSAAMTHSLSRRSLQKYDQAMALKMNLDALISDRVNRADAIAGSIARDFLSRNSVSSEVYAARFDRQRNDFLQLVQQDELYGAQHVWDSLVSGLARVSGIRPSNILFIVSQLHPELGEFLKKLFRSAFNSANNLIPLKTLRQSSGIARNFSEDEFNRIVSRGGGLPITTGTARRLLSKILNHIPESGTFRVQFFPQTGNTLINLQDPSRNSYTIIFRHDLTLSNDASRLLTVPNQAMTVGQAKNRDAAMTKRDLTGPEIDDLLAERANDSVSNFSSSQSPKKFVVSTGLLKKSNQRGEYVLQTADEIREGLKYGSIEAIEVKGEEYGVPVTYQQFVYTHGKKIESPMVTFKQMLGQVFQEEWTTQEGARSLLIASVREAIKRSIAERNKLDINDVQAQEINFIWGLVAPLKINISNEGTRYIATTTIGDHAMLEKPGGIDLNSANLAMLVKRDGKGIVLALNQQDLASFNNIEGLDPVILSIIPARQTPFYSQLTGQP